MKPYWLCAIDKAVLHALFTSSLPQTPPGFAHPALRAARWTVLRWWVLYFLFMLNALEPPLTEKTLSLVKTSMFLGLEAPRKPIERLKPPLRYLDIPLSRFFLFKYYVRQKSPEGATDLVLARKPLQLCKEIY